MNDWDISQILEFQSKLIVATVSTYAVAFVTALVRDYLLDKRFLNGAVDIRYRGLSIRGIEEYVNSAKIVANLIICAAYVHSTYIRNVLPSVSILYRVFGTLFAFDSFVSLYFYSDNSFIDIVSLSYVLQIASLPSLFQSTGKFAYLNFAFFRMQTAYSLYRKTERKYFFRSWTGEKLKVDLRIFVQFFVLFFLLAAGYQFLELPGAFFNKQYDPDEWSYFNSLWFIVVTLSTVGYGDFSPSTIQGRVFVTIMIVLVINIVYTNVAELLYETGQDIRGEAVYHESKGNQHVIVVGNPTLDELVYFIREFYALYRGSKHLSHIRKKIVILMEKEDLIWDEDEWDKSITKNYYGNVWLLSGSYNDERSFERANLREAVAVFVLGSPSCEREYATGNVESQTDTESVNIALSIRKENSHVPIYSQTLLEESKIPIFEAVKVPETDSETEKEALKYAEMSQSEKIKLHEELILKKISKNAFKSRENIDDAKILKKSANLCLDTLYTGMVVGNIKANGISTLCTNMFFDFGLTQTNPDKPWLTEYYMGAACKLLPSFIPEGLNKQRVCEVAAHLLKRGIVLMGVKEKDNSSIQPVTDASVRLHSDWIGIFLTYLDITDLCVALQLVANEVNDGVPANLSMKFKDKMLKSRPFNMKNVSSGQARSTKRTTGNPFGDFPSFAFSSFWSPSDREKISEALSEVNNHVIVTMDTENTDDMINRLSSFLKLLWSEDDSNQKQVEPIDIVVVIHPTFWKPPSCNNRLFFVRGSPYSKDSWAHAKLHHARAVVTMADKNKKYNVTDANTLFSLIMLDLQIERNSDLFVCSEIVDERSLKLFRDPTKSRRRNKKVSGLGMNRASTVFESNALMGSFNEDNESSGELVEQSTIFPRPVMEYPVVGTSSQENNLFSSVRYTSGELLVYSTSSSLLVREFSEPGFIEFVVGLCGANSEKSNQNIHLIQKIPDEIFDEFDLVDGSKKLLEYGVVFERLVNLGVTPLGLYRSGQAPVRMQDSSSTRRSTRGADMYRELQSYLGAEKKATSFAGNLNWNAIKDHFPTFGCSRSNPSEQNSAATPAKSSTSIASFMTGFSSRRSSVHEEDFVAKQDADNVLPYVFTLPEPETLVAPSDGVFVLCASTSMFLNNWEESCCANEDSE